MEDWLGPSAAVQRDLQPIRLVLRCQMRRSLLRCVPWLASAVAWMVRYFPFPRPSMSVLRAARVRAAVAVLRAVAAACFFWAARHASKLERKSRSVISTRVCSCGSAAQKVAAASACSSMALSSCATEVRAARAISKKPVAIS
jgi:hypothetical protein